MIPLNFVRRGEGEPLLLLHSLGGSNDLLNRTRLLGRLGRPLIRR